MAFTSNPRKESPCTLSPVSKLPSAMKPRMPASRSATPASRQYHWAGVRVPSRTVERVVVPGDVAWAMAPPWSVLPPRIPGASGAQAAPGTHLTATGVGRVTAARGGHAADVTSVLERALALPFRAGSALRGARIFHPEGFLCDGGWAIDRDSRLAPHAEALRAGARHEVLARVSRGAGFPDSVPDFYAVAVRLIDAYGHGAHQDLLINASSGLPVVHHLFLPAPRWFAQTYSTCLPYRAGAGQFVIGLLPPRERGPGPPLAAMRVAVAAGVELGIALASPLGRFERVGTLRLHAPHAGGDTPFDPWHTGGGLEPATWLNRIRREAYAQSRRGRGLPG